MPELTERPASQLLVAGDALLLARKYSEALSIAERAVGAEPSNPACHCLVARALLALKKYPQASGAAWQSVRLAPNGALGYRVLAMCLREQGGAERRPSLVSQAVEQARSAARLAPHDPGTLACLAECLADSGEATQADDAVRRAIALAPRSASVWVTATYVALKAGNYRAAEQAARVALSLDPANSAAANNLGVALRRRRRWAKSSVAFAQAARLDPRSAKARDNLELMGFSYMAAFSFLLVLPLLVFPPWFLAARYALAGWLVGKRPARLQPLATRLGLRVARSKRHQRRFDKAAAKAVAKAQDHGHVVDGRAQWTSARRWRLPRWGGRDLVYFVTIGAWVGVIFYFRWHSVGAGVVGGVGLGLIFSLRTWAFSGRRGRVRY